MKRILIFSTAYFPYVGGAETAVKELTDRMLDFEFEMITLKFDKELPDYEKIGRVGVYRIGYASRNPTSKDLLGLRHKINKLLFPFRASRLAKKLHKKKKYDAIWGIMAAYAGFATMFFKHRHKEMPYLLTLQEGDPIDYIKKKVRLVYPWFRNIFLSASHIQAISNHLAYFARDMGYQGEISVVPNGVDFKHFSREYSLSEIDVLKEKIGKKEKDVYLVHTGRFVPKNAVDDLIKSLNFLDKHIKLVLIGNGPDEQKLKDLVKSENLLKRVNFMGFVSHNNLPLYLRACDIFVRASLTEGFGNSFVEAMAADLPVIATPVGGIIDFLHDPDKNPEEAPTGLFCEPKNPESIAQKVKMYIRNTEMKNEIVFNARTMVSQKYCWDDLYIKIDKIFKKITL